MKIKLSQIQATLEKSYCTNLLQNCDDFEIGEICYIEKILLAPKQGVLYLIKEKNFKDDKKYWDYWLRDCVNIRAAAYCVPRSVEVEQIQTTVYREISEFYEKRYNQIVDINMKFMDISLKTPSLEYIIQCFAKICENPVIIYDEFFNVVLITNQYVRDYNREPKKMDKYYMVNLFYYKQEVYFESEAAPVKKCSRLLFPVLQNDMAKGYLAIFDANQSYEEMDFTILEIFANNILMEMKRLLDLEKVEAKYVSDFLYDLIFRKTDKQEDIRRRAKVLKVEEKASYCLIAVNPLGKMMEMRVDTNGYITQYEFMNDRIMNNVANFLTEKHKKDIVTRFDKTILIVHRLTERDKEEYVKVRELCKWLQNQMNRLFEGMVFQIGFGTIVDSIDEISLSYRQAMAALNYGELLYLQKKEFIISYNDSSLLKVFSTLKETDSLYDIIPNNLLRLKEHDEMYKANLFETLKTYLECNCNAKKASERLYIHYKTMLYRLEKMRNDFEISLDDGTFRIQIELGIKMLSIMDMQDRKDLG